MKQGVFVFTIIFLLLIEKSTAQYCTAPTFVKRQLWLFNSEGKIAASQDSVVSTKYFDSKRINIQTDVPFDKDVRFYCAFEKDGAQTYAHYFRGTTLPDEVIQKIKAWGKGGAITFGVEEISDGRRKISFLKFVLE